MDRMVQVDLFQEDYPELAKQLMEAKQLNGTKNFMFDKDYCYHLTKGANVERQSLIENPQPTKCWKIPFEKSPNQNPSAYGRIPQHHGTQKPIAIIRNQRRLLEEPAK
jgi:hypothetical protein